MLVVCCKAMTIACSLVTMDNTLRGTYYGILPTNLLSLQKIDQLLTIAFLAFFTVFHAQQKQIKGIRSRQKNYFSEVRSCGNGHFDKSVNFSRFLVILPNSRFKEMAIKSSYAIFSVFNGVFLTQHEIPLLLICNFNMF